MYGIDIGSSSGGSNLARDNRIVGNGLGLNNSASSSFNATFNSWGGNCGPDFSPYNTGTGDEISNVSGGDVLFYPYVGICIKDKINPVCSSELDNVTLRATVNDSLASLPIDDVWFSYTINGTNYNKTATNIGSNYSVIINNSALVGGQNITWTVYANDTSGAIVRNGIENFYVRLKTMLSTNPANPDGLNNWYITEPEFTLFNTDTASIFYQWDSDDIFLYSSPFKLENIPNQPNVTAGILDLNYWSGFTCGDETHQEQIFKVDLTNPVIDETPAANSIVYNNLRPNISAYLDEIYQSNSGINLSTINMEVDGGLVTSTNISQNGLDALVWFVPASDLSVGNHTVMVNATDNAGRYSFKEWTFTIALTPALSLTIHSPQNQTYDTRRIPINVSLNGTVELLQYINYMDNNPRLRNLCKECNSSGFYKEKEITFREGENILGIRATDFFGAVNEENVTFFIDSKLPKIARTEPTRNSFTNGSNFYIKYTESNVAELLLSLNSTLNLTSQCNVGGKNQECFFNVNLSAYDGIEVSYQFNMTDVAGNKGNSKLTPVKVDTTDPVVNLFNYTIDGKRVEFIVNVDEINFEEINYIDSSDNNPREKRLCSSLKNNSCKKKVSFSSGNHSIDIIVRDKAGNTAVVENVLISL